MTVNEKWWVHIQNKNREHTQNKIQYDAQQQIIFHTFRHKTVNALNFAKLKTEIIFSKILAKVQLLKCLNECKSKQSTGMGRNVCQKKLNLNCITPFALQ